MSSRRTLVRLMATLAVFVAVAIPHASARAQSPTPTRPARPRVMVALVFGQSNAGNWGESRRVAGPRVFNFFRGRYERARDPLPGANGNGGSVWTRLGDKLIAAKLYDRVVFVPASIGATEIAQWAPGGALHKDLLRNVREAQKARLVFTHLLWHQGESDAVLGTSAEDYQRRFRAMLAAIRALGVDAPAFVAVATRCGQYLPNETIRAAQIGLADPESGIFLGPDTDQLGPEYRHDGCHFSDLGLEVHAEMWLQVIRAHEAHMEAAQRRPG
ncbi:MAG: sialate O-acetylesterase [Thermoflexales bacterium]|nr:sialate O-acetylesterase [Thermoflexales bacterium]MDW8350794.1 sialate O-acetylesterase [Anaerolineae bacterium]